MLCPVLMVRNEENYIRQVLRPLVACFPHVIVSETGSTDGTLDILRNTAGIILVERGNLSPQQLGKCRQDMGLQAKSLGYDWILQVDGDELYHPDAAKQLATFQMPEGKKVGLTCMCGVSVRGGEYCYALPFTRVAILPSDDEWIGEHPWERPQSFDNVANHFVVMPPPLLDYHALHVSDLPRSSRPDSDTYQRKELRNRYPNPCVTPLPQMWLDVLKG